MRWDRLVKADDGGPVTTAEALRFLLVGCLSAAVFLAVVMAGLALAVWIIFGRI